MRTKDCYYLGFIAKTVGVKGELVVFLEAINPLDINNLESVLIQIEGKLVPFFIERINFRSPKGEAVIRFEDIDTIEKARHLCNRDMYLPMEDLSSSEVESSHIHNVKGYKAYNEKGSYLGVIQEILDYPGNPVFRIIKDDHEILIPAANDFIKKTDHTEGSIYLLPPDGLLDLYT